MSTPQLPVKTTAAKAVVSGIAQVAVAVTTLMATLSIVLGDDAIDAGEVGSVIVAVVTFLAGVRAVWQVPNRPVQDVRSRPEEPEMYM